MIIGPNDKEYVLYEALIVSGISTVSDVARRTGIKRPTAYLYLDALIKQGLVERIEINKKTCFRAHDPRVLSSSVELQRQKVEALSAIYQNVTLTQNNPRVRIFEGRQHEGHLYADMHQANSLVGWYGVGDTVPHIPSAALYKFADYIKENKVTFRDIIPHDARSITYARRMRRIMGSTYTFRISPNVMIENDTIVYGNKILMRRRHEHEFYAIVIDDASFANTFRSIFNMSWKSLAPRKSEPSNDPLQ